MTSKRASLVLSIAVAIGCTDATTIGTSSSGTTGGGGAPSGGAGGTPAQGGGGAGAQGGGGGEAGAGGSIGTECADVCADGALDPSDACGGCLFLAVADGACTAEVEACYADAPGGDCMSCAEHLAACDGGCPALDALCPSSRVLLDALNACFCVQCGGGPPSAELPGFSQCHPPEKPPSPCDGLGLTACVATPGCQPLLGDPCPGVANCIADPKFRECVVTSGAPAMDPCPALDAAGCTSRDDCAVVRHDTKNCCPQPLWAAPFVECRNEPTPPPQPPTCIGLRVGACIAAADCTPLFFLLNGPIACGPALHSPGECQSCYVDDYIDCADAWQ